MVTLPTGSRLGRYQMLERLGRGGMATVFRALDPELNRHVAVKVLPSFQAEDPTFVARFRQEAQAVAGLNHPYIVQVYDFGEDKGFNYIVMEYVSGGTLNDRVGRPVSLTETLALITPIAEALGYAHGQGVIHRDVKPSNILLDANAKPKVSDFGLARLVEASAGFTRSDSVLGTPEYMSPEQALGLLADSRSDLYAFGVLVYQMLLGQPPFRGETPSATLMAHIHQPVPLPTSLASDLDVRLEGILLRALAKDPSERYEGPVQMVTAMAGLLSGPKATADFDAARTIAGPVSPPSRDPLGVGPSAVADQPKPSTRAEVARITTPKVRLSDHCLVMDADLTGAAKPPFSLGFLVSLPLFLIDRRQHFGGLRGLAWRLIGVRRGSRNPNICNGCAHCFNTRQLSEVTVLAADSEDLSTMLRTQGPQIGSALVEEFFTLCSAVVVNHDGIVDRYGANGVICFFNTPIRRVDHVDQAIAAAIEIQLASRRIKIGEGGKTGLTVGISVDTGLAFAGLMGSKSCGDYTILGDVVSVASRLQQEAADGGILVTEQVFEVIEGAYPKLEGRMLQVRGIPEPVRTYRLS